MKLKNILLGSLLMTSSLVVLTSANARSRIDEDGTFTLSGKKLLSALSPAKKGIVTLKDGQSFIIKTNGPKSNTIDAKNWDNFVKADMKFTSKRKLDGTFEFDYLLTVEENDYTSKHKSGPITVPVFDILLVPQTVEQLIERDKQFNERRVQMASQQQRHQQPQMERQRRANAAFIIPADDPSGIDEEGKLVITPIKLMSAFTQANNGVITLNGQKFMVKKHGSESETTDPRNWFNVCRDMKFTASKNADGNYELMHLDENQGIITNVFHLLLKPVTDADLREKDIHLAPKTRVVTEQPAQVAPTPQVQAAQPDQVAPHDNNVAAVQQNDAPQRKILVAKRIPKKE